MYNNYWVRVLASLAEVNEELGYPPRIAFERAFTQIIEATDDELLMMGQEVESAIEYLALVS